jgi:hypothetical protein
VQIASQALALIEGRGELRLLILAGVRVSPGVPVATTSPLLGLLAGGIAILAGL